VSVSLVVGSRERERDIQVLPFKSIVARQELTGTACSTSATSLSPISSPINRKQEIVAVCSHQTATRTHIEREEKTNILS